MTSTSALQRRIDALLNAKAARDGNASARPMDAVARCTRAAQMYAAGHPRVVEILDVARRRLEAAEEEPH